MNYSDLIQAYFERSVAMQWYWTLYVLVIGGVVGFSTFRRHREPVTTILISILFACFAFKNEGAIVATAEEREAIRAAFREYPAAGTTAEAIQLTRAKVEPTLTEYDIPGARYFHWVCDVLTICFLGVKEWRREPSAPRE
jgi:hypothetical protein